MPLEEIIKNIITSSDADLYCKKADWKNATASQDGAFCERKNIVVELQGGKKRYKYVEVTKWNTEKKQCVAIGFNPSEHDVNTIDKTNNKLIEKMKNRGYDSFILLNLNPQVTKRVDLWVEDEEDRKFARVLQNVFKKIAETKCDVLIFWGRSVGVDGQIEDFLTKLQKENRLFVTVKKGTKMHYHPARVDIEIEPATSESIVKSISIK